MVLESKGTLLELGQGTEVVGRENFSLNDREVDLDLVEPAGVNWCVDKNGVGPLGAETVDRFLPAMNGTIVHDPEDSARCVIRRLAHNLTNQAIHGSNAVLGGV